MMFTFLGSSSHRPQKPIWKTRAEEKRLTSLPGTPHVPTHACTCMVLIFKINNKNKVTWHPYNLMQIYVYAMVRRKTEKDIGDSGGVGSWMGGGGGCWKGECTVHEMLCPPPPHNHPHTPPSHNSIFPVFSCLADSMTCYVLPPPPDTHNTTILLQNSPCVLVSVNSWFFNPKTFLEWKGHVTFDLQGQRGQGQRIQNFTFINCKVLICLTTSKHRTAYKEHINLFLTVKVSPFCMYIKLIVVISSDMLVKPYAGALTVFCRGQKIDMSGASI